MLGISWLGIALLWLALDASRAIVLLAYAATLPLLVDLLRNSKAGVSLSDTTLRWYSGRKTAEVALAQIACARLDTRLDLSVKLTLILTDGRKLRLPLEAIPPADMFEDALKARGLRVERHHFSLMG